MNFPLYVSSFFFNFLLSIFCYFLWILSFWVQYVLETLYLNLFSMGPFKTFISQCLYSSTLWNSYLWFLYKEIFKFPFLFFWDSYDSCIVPLEFIIYVSSQNLLLGFLLSPTILFSCSYTFLVSELILSCALLKFVHHFFELIGHHYFSKR